MSLFDKFKKKEKKSVQEEAPVVTEQPIVMENANANQTVAAEVSIENNPFVEQIAPVEEVPVAEQPPSFDNIFNATPSDLIMPESSPAVSAEPLPNVAETAAVIDNPNSISTEQSVITVDPSSVFEGGESTYDEITALVSDSVAASEQEPPVEQPVELTSVVEENVVETTPITQEEPVMNSDEIQPIVQNIEESVPAEPSVENVEYVEQPIIENNEIIEQPESTSEEIVTDENGAIELEPTPLVEYAEEPTSEVGEIEYQEPEPTYTEVTPEEEIQPIAEEINYAEETPTETEFVPEYTPEYQEETQIDEPIPEENIVYLEQESPVEEYEEQINQDDQVINTYEEPISEEQNYIEEPVPQNIEETEQPVAEENIEYTEQPVVEMPEEVQDINVSDAYLPPEVVESQLETATENETPVEEPTEISAPLFELTNEQRIENPDIEEVPSEEPIQYTEEVPSEEPIQYTEDVPTYETENDFQTTEEVSYEDVVDKEAVIPELNSEYPIVTEENDESQEKSSIEEPTEKTEKSLLERTNELILSSVLEAEESEAEEQQPEENVSEAPNDEIIELIQPMEEETSDEDSTSTEYAENEFASTTGNDTNQEPEKEEEEISPIDDIVPIVEDNIELPIFSNMFTTAEKEEEQDVTETSEEEKSLAENYYEEKNIQDNNEMEVEATEEETDSVEEEEVKPIIEEDETIILPILTEEIVNKYENKEKEEKEPEENEESIIRPIIEEDDLTLGFERAEEKEEPIIEEKAEEIIIPAEEENTKEPTEEVTFLSSNPPEAEEQNLPVIDFNPYKEEPKEDITFGMDEKEKDSESTTFKFPEEVNYIDFKPFMDFSGIKENNTPTPVAVEAKPETGTYISEPTITKFCNNCGIMLTDDSSICPSCGEPID